MGQEKSPEYFKNLDVSQLVCFIQPLWNKYNMGHGESSMSEVEVRNLTNALTEYKSRGLDIEYFTNGAGAPGNCTIC